MLGISALSPGDGARKARTTVVAAIFDRILPLVPGLTEKLEEGISVLDVGCGRGRALVAMAERFPKSRFVGYDLCEEPIAMAARRRRSAD